MTRFCPVYPTPKARRASLLKLFFSARYSWLDSLFERSYTMHLGEVHLPSLDLYMVNEPALVHRVLIEEVHHFPKSALLDAALKPLLGDSIFTTNGAQWERQRRMMEPSFEQARLKSVFASMSAAAHVMQMRLQQLLDRANVDVEQEMTLVTADIIFRTILSTSLNEGDAGQIFNAFKQFQRHVPKLISHRIFGIPSVFSPLLTKHRAGIFAQQIRSLLGQAIAPRFAAFHAGMPDPHQDILSELLKARDQATGQSFSSDELLDQVTMLFLAGHETSASALSWALYLLANSTEVQARCYDEVIAMQVNDQLTYATIRKLQLVRNVVRETLRLYPPVGFFARQSQVTTMMRDKVVRRDAAIVVAPWLIHRHRTLWDKPDEFNPDRFACNDARESIKNAYLPFGLGPRVCIGASFALQEATLILATLIKHFRFEALANVQPKPVGRLTIRSDNGIQLRVCRR